MRSRWWCLVSRGVWRIELVKIEANKKQETKKNIIKKLVRVRLNV